jgi:hypothetical protein
VIRFVLLALLSFSAYSADKVEMDFSAQDFNQGELIETRLQRVETSTFEWKNLKGQTIENTLYFYDLSPVSQYEAKAKVIFTKIPESYEIQSKIDGKQIIFNWGGIKINPTEPDNSFIFGTFDISEKMLWGLWSTIAFLGISLFSFAAWIIFRRFKLRKKKKERLLILKNEIMGCRNYEDVVNLWKRKHILLNEFPHIDEAFHKMEEILNLHQFKPKIAEAEKIEVVESYRKFSRSVEGGFNGI